MTGPDESPNPHELADENDDLDWDVERDGRMRQYATDPDDEPATVPWEGHPAEE